MWSDDEMSETVDDENVVRVGLMSLHRFIAVSLHVNRNKQSISPRRPLILLPW